jgi:hypothetical protein
MTRPIVRFGVFPFVLGSMMSALVLAGEPGREGPPWKRKLADAQKEAIDKELPLFVYFSSNICTPCKIVEERLLPDPALKEVYGKAVWLYVNRKRDNSEADHAAELIELRFGVILHPQLLLVDPEKLEFLSYAGYNPQQIVAAIGKAKVAPQDAKGAIERLQKAEKKLAALEKQEKQPNTLNNKKFLAHAKELLADEDIVVRIRAVQIVARQEPKAIVPLAPQLLEARNDVLRFEVCKVLAQLGDTNSAPALESLVKDPEGSLNPNVLRTHAVEALAKCGRAESAEVLGPIAADANVDNQLTFAAVDTLAAIGARLAKANDKVGLRAVVEALARGYPSARPARIDPSYTRRANELLGKVHGHLTKLCDKKVPIPQTYDEAARAWLMEQWLK